VGLGHVLSNPIVRVVARTGHPEIMLVLGLALCFVDLGSLTSLPVVGFGLVLIVCAFAGKLVCALGVLRGGVGRLAVGIGMIPRGEVGLIFAGIGTTLTLAGQPLLSPSLFSAVVLMVLVTTLVTPVGLRWAFQRRGV
jgi:Na+:H+ antiporter